MGRIALNFDLTAIPEHATVTNAELLFYRIGDYYGYDMDGTYEAHLINESWTSSTATWENLSTSYEQTVIASLDYTRGTTGWFDFDVTDATAGLVANPSENLGFMILIDFVLNSSTNGHISKIHSSESSEESLQPKIVVEYTATPIITDNAPDKLQQMAVNYGTGKLRVSTVTDGNYTILFHTGNGRLLYKMDERFLKAGTQTITCDKSHFVKGVVFITVQGNRQSAISKAVVY